MVSKAKFTRNECAMKWMQFFASIIVPSIIPNLNRNVADVCF